VQLYQTDLFASTKSRKETPAPPLCGGVGAQPLGFIDTPISVTEKFNPYTAVSSYGEYQELREKLKLSKLRKKLRYEYSVDPPSFFERYAHEIALENSPPVSLFRVSRYRSGELVGNTVLLGGKSHTPFPSRPVKLVTQSLTLRANRVLRRSVECSPSTLKYFVTLTFAPSMLTPEQKNPDGSVCHVYAKKRLYRFLNTIKVKMTRMGRRLDYLWVAEIQENSTNNIHFHIMWNQWLPINWLSKLWGQASNSVDVEKISDARHGCNYIRKYLGKSHDAGIEGNRYGISAGLRESIQPEVYAVPSFSPLPVTEETALRTIRLFSEDIERSGGFVHDYGFCVGAPSRPTVYRRRDGTTGKTKGIPRHLSEHIMNALLGEVPF
jgi:hypothetical protein